MASFEVSETSNHKISGAPSIIPPRTSSHGVAFPASSPPRSSSQRDHHNSPHKHLASAGFVDTQYRKSSKRPVSTTSENWLAQSSGKKPLLAGTIPESTVSAHSHHDRLSADYSDWVKLPLKARQLKMTPNGTSKQPPETIGDEFIHSKERPWNSEKEKILLGPYDYLFSQPGKDIRQQLISAFNEWLQVPEEKLAIITKVVGMLHTASLLVDDVEDSSILRRGEPVAHSIFGIPQVINTANYVYFLALQELSTLNNPSTIQIFTEELLNLHRGQGMDLYWRDTLTCPMESDYLEMVHNKTGGLFRLAIKLMQAESTTIKNHAAQQNGHHVAIASEAHHSSSNTAHSPKSEISCIPLINTIGLLFQILDDLLNLCSTTYHSRKGHAEDLTEGKFSFPVIHAIRADPTNLVLINVLRQRTTNSEVKRHAVDYMERIGSFEYTKGVIAELEKKAVKEVVRLEEQIGGENGKGGGERIRGILGKLKAL